MPPTPGDTNLPAGSEANLTLDLQRELHRQLVAANAIAWWVLPLAVLVTVGVLLNELWLPVLSGWAVVALIDSTVVYLSAHRNKRRREAGQSAGNRTRRNRLHFLTVGVVWGSLPLLTALFGSDLGTWLALMMNMAAMAVLTFMLGSSELYFLTAFIPLFVLTTLGIVFSGLPQQELLLMMILYAGVLWRTHKQFYAVHRERIQSALRNQAHAVALSRSLELRDSLTGLLNKAGLQHWLSNQQSAYQLERPVLITLGSILGFREINFLYGSDTADRLLAALAKRLTSEAKGQFAVARISGAEFLLADLRGNANPEEHTALFTLLEHDPLIINERMVTIGIQQTWVRGPVEELEQLIAVAQNQLRALYKERIDEHGEVRQQLEQRRLLLRSFDQALQDGDIQAWFQPIVDCKLNRITGWEALVRWVHPELGIVPPDRFLDIARISGQASQLTRMMLRSAAGFAQTLVDQGLHQAARVSVNFSATELRNPSTVEWVGSIIAETAIPPQQLVIEMSEKEALIIDEQFALNLYALKRMGLSIAIDDFGTGFANLGHLLDLPASTLKIDKRFIDRLPADRNSIALVKGILTMASGLGMKAIAEGVERSEQLQFLTELGCDAYQGYLAGVALPPRAALDLAARWANTH